MNMHKIAAFTLAGLLSGAAFAADNTGTGTHNSMDHGTHEQGTMGGTGTGTGTGTGGMDSGTGTGTGTTDMPGSADRPATTTGSDQGTGADTGADGAPGAPGTTGTGGEGGERGAY